MNNRLTLQDLAGLLAEYTGKDKFLMERFLKEFVSVVSQSVCVDKIVKVKELGTFKIIPVEERESIHVNTGERFLIPAHYKFSFLPDPELKELVNKPFSFFETTELNENIEFSDMDVSEETVREGEEDESVEEVSFDEKILTQPEIMTEEVHRIDEHTTSQIQPHKENTPEPKPENAPKETLVTDMKSMPAVPIQKKGGVEDPVPSEPFLPKKRNPKKMICLGVFFVALFITGNVLIYLNRDFFLKSNDAKKDFIAIVPDTLHKTDTSEFVPTVAMEMDTVSIAAVDTSLNRPDTVTNQTPQILAKVKIEPGSRLTLISLEYYGSKLFWVYLYEYNKAIIKNPNNVPIGTVIEVPAPEIYGINAHDRASLNKAAAKQTEIQNGIL